MSFSQIAIKSIDETGDSAEQMKVCWECDLGKTSTILMYSKKSLT